jgi:hypothetical protein
VSWYFVRRLNVVDGLLRGQPHAISIVHSRNVDALRHRFDFVAEVGEKPQRIGRIAGDTRNQAGDQQLARRSIHPSCAPELFPGVVCAPCPRRKANARDGSVLARQPVPR